MKKFGIILLLLVCFCSIFAQKHKWYPKSETQQTCFGCGGRGYNSFTGFKCMTCNGLGYNSMTAKAGANDGLANGLVITGKNQLCNKQYRLAFETFWEVYQNMDKHNAGGAVCYWLGICFEMGFGVNCDRDAALSLYKYSMEQNYSLGTKEYNRVMQNGFYPATNEQREKFVARQKQQDYEDAIRFEAMKDTYREINELQKEQLEERRRDRRNETWLCPVCKGSGRYSNPNERYFSQGTYVCNNCGKRQSYSYHHSCTCNRCGGTGNVRR